MGLIPIVGLGLPTDRGGALPTASYGPTPTASEQRSREGPAWKRWGPCALGPMLCTPPSLLSGSALLSCSLFRRQHGWRSQARPCPAGSEEASGPSHLLVSLSKLTHSLQGREAGGWLVRGSGFP